MSCGPQRTRCGPNNETNNSGNVPDSVLIPIQTLSTANDTTTLSGLTSAEILCDFFRFPGEGVVRGAGLLTLQGHTLAGLDTCGVSGQQVNLSVLFVGQRHPVIRRIDAA